jgi:ribosomal protein S18 acetylase RimI-like enzyme
MRARIGRNQPIAKELAMTAAGLAASAVLIRPAVPDDIPTVVEFRSRMFRELGWSDESRLATVAPLADAYLREQFASGGCTGYVAERPASDAGEPSAIVATVVVVWQFVPPSPRNLAGRQAYVLGMYVVPEYRRFGIARRLMEATVACATAAGVPVITLHASNQGAALYEQLGFHSTPEMRLFTEHAGESAWQPVDEAD